MRQQWKLSIILFVLFCATAAFAAGSLYIEAEFLIEDFNRAGERLNTNLEASPPTIFEGKKHDTFTSSVGGGMSITGNVDKQWRMVSSATLTGANSGTEEGRMAITQFMIAAYPKLSPEEAWQLMEKMGLFDSKLKKGTSKGLTFKGQKFFYTYSSKDGLSVSVEGLE